MQRLSSKLVAKDLQIQKLLSNSDKINLVKILILEKLELIIVIINKFVLKRPR